MLALCYARPDEGDKRDIVSCTRSREPRIVFRPRTAKIRSRTAMDPPPPTPPGGGGGGFLSNRRIKLTAVFPMIGGSRRAALSKSDSSSLAKSGKSTVAAAAAGTATAAERPPQSQQPASRNRMRRGSSLTDLNRSDSLAGTYASLQPLRPDPDPADRANPLLVSACPIRAVIMFSLFDEREQAPCVPRRRGSFFFF